MQKQYKEVTSPYKNVVASQAIFSHGEEFSEYQPKIYILETNINITNQAHSRKYIQHLRARCTEKQR